MSNKSKPPASLSLDLDNKWSYLKTHGDEIWESYPSYFDVAVPRFLEFLEDRNLKITVFVVGQDAVLDYNKDAIASIADAGHEIANHSFNHEPWLHLYSPEQLEEEFARTEKALFDVTGQKTVGFRGPGFSLSDQVLKTLINRGYEYDCSTFPTYLGPLARAYYFMTAQLSKDQKEERKALFGTVKDGLQSNKPYEWHGEQERLLEIPVTTMPIFKVPIHASYILYLGGFSTMLAKLYFWKAIQMCRLFRVQPSILLHPLDFLGQEDDSDLAFFPAMNQSAERKIKLLSSTLGMLTKHYEVMPMRDHARAISRNNLAQRAIDSATEGAPSQLA